MTRYGCHWLGAALAWFGILPPGEPLTRVQLRLVLAGALSHVRPGDA